jgi:hypothetical protein
MAVKKHMQFEQPNKKKNNLKKNLNLFIEEMG